MEPLENVRGVGDSEGDVEGSGEDTVGWSHCGNWPRSCCGNFIIVPDGVVTVMTSVDCGSELTSMRYPAGRKGLKPWIK